MATIRSLSKFFMMVMAVGLISACASTPVDTTANGTPIYDPLESVNRANFALNKGLDQVIFDPTTKLYRTVVPSPARAGVNNFLDNLKSPVYFANEILQGDFADAGTVILRFLINSFTGFGGLMDTAGYEGITYVSEDFGQTLASWGVDAGPYIVWPIMGPSTMRDSTGFVVDSLMDPIGWVLMDAEQDGLMYTRTALTVLNTKDQIMDVMNDLYRSSIDPYAALRSVYYQRRDALINDLDPEAAAANGAYADFDELD